MSGNIGEHQRHHTLSNVSPRKRPRQESACDVDSGLADSEGSGGASGSGSSDNGENGDGRQGGSQKRARSEGHGDSEVSRDSIPWHRSAESRATSTHAHASSAVPSSSTRISSAATIPAPRYLNPSESIRGLPSEESFIPLPPVLSTAEMQRDASNYGDSPSVGHTLREDIARSMAFDEQMESLRRSPASLPESPLTTQQPRSTEAPMEVQIAPEPEPSLSSEGPSPDSSGDLEGSESELRAQSEVDRPNSSGRLHTLADTASMHSRILHTPTTRGASTLPPILPPFPAETEPAISADPSSAYSAPPSRLRMQRRNEQSRSQTWQASQSPTPSFDLGDVLERSLAVAREPSGSTDHVMRTSIASRIGRPSSTAATSSPSTTDEFRQTPYPSAYPIPGRNRHTSPRIDLSHEIHNPFDPFGLDDHPFPDLDRPEQLTPLGSRAVAVGRPRRQSSSPTPHDSVGQRLRLGTDQDRQNDHHMSDIATDDHLIGPGRAAVNASGIRGDAAGVTPWRHGGSDRVPGSFWASIFDEPDSERDGSPHRAGSTFDDIRRHASDSERDAPSRHHSRFPYDMFRDDLRRRSSVWDSPRHTPGRSENDRTPQAASTSSSSTSSYGRSTSRSLLDPTLSFGSGSSGMNSHSSLSSDARLDQETTSRSRFRSRARLALWFGERSTEEEAEPVDLNRPTLSGDLRSGEGLSTFSPFFSSSEFTRINDHPFSPGTSSRQVDNLRNTQAGAARLIPAHPPAVDRGQAFHSPSPTYDSESPTIAHQPRSPGSWESDSALPDIPDRYPSRFRPNIFPALPRFYARSSAFRTDGPFSSFGPSEHPLPVSSRFRLRRHPIPGQELSPGGPELPTDAMEGIIPESNARDNGSLSAHSFRRRPPLSPTLAGRHSLPRIEPPPRPVEPRVSNWNIDLRPNVRLPPLRSPSPPPFPPLRSDFASDRPRRPADFSRTVFNPPFAVGPNEHPLDQQRLSYSVESEERRPSLISPNPTRIDSRPEQGTSDQSSPGRHGTGPRPETFNELVRRRAARAEMQSRANRRPHSPDALSRPAYRLPRPSFLADDEDTNGRRERIARLERRTDAALSGRPLLAGDDSALNDSRRERQRAALLLERSISSRHAVGDRPLNRQDWDRYHDNLMQPAPPGPSQPSDREERIDGLSPNFRTRMSERLGRHPSFPTPVHSLRPEGVGVDLARGRQELHDAIGRRARDDELSTRRSLTNTERTRHIAARDPMSTETTRNLQRRIRESEAEVDRALNALNQWGELEGSGDSDPTQSRLHRFGETSRRRRVPPAFSFSDSSWDQDPVIAPGPANTRPGRRSPSPTTAAARLQTRQARFARAQGRFREMGTDMFGEPRSRGAFASRLEMLAGSRFASRYIARNLGDYMRDEDFDASYENLVRLAASVGEAKPRGTPAHLLAAMPTGFYKDFATPGCDSRCPICLDDYKDLDPILRISDCDHWFHKECLEQWLSGENSCPICRRRIRGHPDQGPPDNVPGPSGSRRDDGSDDDGPGSGSGDPGRSGSPGLTLEELNSYAAGW